MTAPLTHDLRKVTVQVPQQLLDAAQEHTDEGITQTIIAGLEKLAVSKAYRNARALRGSVKKLDLDLDASRAERDF